MYKNKAPDGKNNLCGDNVAALRKGLTKLKALAKILGVTCD